MALIRCLSQNNWFIFSSPSTDPPAMLSFLDMAMRQMPTCVDTHSCVPQHLFLLDTNLSVDFNIAKVLQLVDSDALNLGCVFSFSAPAHVFPMQPSFEFINGEGPC